MSSSTHPALPPKKSPLSSPGKPRDSGGYFYPSEHRHTLHVKQLARPHAAVVAGQRGVPVIAARVLDVHEVAAEADDLPRFQRLNRVLDAGRRREDMVVGAAGGYFLRGHGQRVAIGVMIE